MSLASGKKNDRASTKRGEGAKAADMKCKCGKAKGALELSKRTCSKSGGSGGGRKEPLEHKHFGGMWFENLIDSQNTVCIMV
jgi:hypothetical protein